MGEGILAQSAARLARPAAQAPACEGAVWGERYALLLRAGQHLAFVFTEQQIHVVLYGDELRPAMFAGDGVGLLQLPRRDVRRADVPRLAGGHGVREALHDLLDRRAPIPHVVDVQVHVVHTEMAQTHIEIVADVLLAAHAVLDLLVGARQELRGHHHIVACRHGGERAAEVFLGRAVLVDDCRV